MYIQTCWVKWVKYHTYVRTSGTSGVNLEKKKEVFPFNREILGRILGPVKVEGS